MASLLNMTSIFIEGNVSDHPTPSVGPDGEICLYISIQGSYGTIFFHGTPERLILLGDTISSRAKAAREAAAEKEIAAEGLDAAGMNDGK